MNSNIEHQATVDKGLKMKIKRKNVSGANNKAEPKHEIVKPDSGKCVASTPGGGGGVSGSSGGGGGATSSGGSGTTGGSSSVVPTSSVSDTGVSGGSGSGGGGGGVGGNAATATTSGVASGPACSASCSSVVVGSGGTNGVLLLTDKMKPSPSGDGNNSNNSNNNNNNNNSSKQEKSPKMKGSHKKEKMKDKTKSSASGTSSTSSSLSSSSSSILSSSSSSTSSSSATTISTSTASSSSSSSASSISCPPPPPLPPSSSSSLSLSSSSTPCSSSSSISCPAPSSGADCCVSNGNNNPSSSAAVISNGLDTSTIYNPVLEPRGGDVPHLKKENPTPDPYEFNAKVEDGFGIPMKKIKVEKVEAACSPMQPELHDMGTDTCSVGVITEPECLGPCEPGTSVTLEGIVWHETENGVLVINVTWRGKTYVGTLLDATKHDWAPPRFNCDSPVSDFESRTPKGRGKRGRGNTATPVNERLNISGGNNTNNNNNSSSNNSSSSNNNNNNNNSSNNNNSNSNNNNEGRKLRKGRRCGGGNSFQAPASPAKLEHDRSSSLKRKGRPSDLDLSVPSDPCKGSKRCRSSWRSGTSANSNTSTSGSNNNNNNNNNGSNNNNSNSSGSSSSINNSSMSSATISLSSSGNSVASTGSASGESSSPVLLKCPEANCNKQYKHINGLRYHQSHAHHSSMLQAQEADENLRDEDAISMEGNITDEEVGRSRKDETNEKGSRKEKIKEELQSDDNIHAEEGSTAGDLNQEQISYQSADEASDEQKVLLDKTSIKCEITSLGETIKSEKVIKSEHPSSCCASIHPSSGLSVGGSVSKPLPNQIYQLSGAPMGCLGTGGVSMVTQTNCQTSPMPSMSASSMASSVVSQMSSQSLLTSVTTFGTISHVAESCRMEMKDSEKTIKTEKISVVDKSKCKTPTRPIVPAPSPQLMAFPGSVSSSHTGLTSVPTTHTQVSPSLKPIQPKPTILGESMNINSSLVNFKDKKPKQKKKCSKEKELGKCDIPSLKGDHTPKYERTAVIKSVASPPKPGLDLMPKKDSSLMEPPHLISDLSRSTVSSLGCANSVISSQISPKSLDPNHVTRMTQPPGLLKVGAPMPGLLSTPDRKTPVNDDVQSPAYSDISDANESGSPTQGDTPVKVKEESSSSRKEEKHQGRNSPEPPPTAVPHYGMYGYYGQSSYLVPNVSQPSSHVSQSSASNSVSGSSSVGNHKASTSIKSEPPQGVVVSCQDDKMGVSLEEGMKMGEEKKIKEEKEDPKHKEGAPPGGGGGGGGGGGSGGGGPSSAAAAAAISPHDYQQKWYQQYYAWPQPPHFQYLYGYVDPSFHMHHLADPQYRQQYEKALEDQKRAQHYPGKDSESCKKSIEFQNKSGLPDDLKVSSHSDISPNVHTIKSSPHNMALKSNQADKGPERESRKIMVDKSLEREREQAIREKKNENHQIMNENFEVKSQMDKSRCEMSEAEAYRMQHNDVRHEGIPHFYMYQQQKLFEQEKRKMEYGPKPDMQAMELMMPKGGHKMLEHGRLIPNDEILSRDNNTSSNSGNSSKRDLLDMKTKEVMVRDIKPINKPIPDLCQTSDKRMMMMDKLRSPAESQKLKSSYSLSLGNSSSGGSGVIGGGGSSGGGGGGGGSGGGGGGGGNNSSSNNSNMPPSSSSSSSSTSSSNNSSSSSSSVPSSNSNTAVSAATSANYPHYVPYPYMQSPGYSPLHFDAYRQFNPVLSYPNSSYLHPSHLGYRLNQNDVEKEEKNTSSQKNILNQPVLPSTELEPSSKSAEVIHHSSATSYYEVHKMSELQEKTSSRPSSNCHSSPHPKTSISETSVSPSPNFDKTRDYQNSPPTQRHVHTHHHTHVVGATFPLYPFTNK